MDGMLAGFESWLGLTVTDLLTVADSQRPSGI
jgi:hypothetical protein